MKNRMLFLSMMLVMLGSFMLFGSSYSLIMNEMKGKEILFTINNFDERDNQYLNLDLTKEKEMILKVQNNSDYDINYHLNMIEINNLGDDIEVHYTLNNTINENILLKEKNTIIENHVLAKGKEDVYQMSFTFNSDNPSIKRTVNLSLTARKKDNLYASNVIEQLSLSNVNYLTKVNNDYRFIGKNVPNYVWFNCDKENNCEKWRIIGLFDNKEEKSNKSYPSLKIMKDISSDESVYNKGKMDGDFDNSFIEAYLNGAYYLRLSNESKKLLLRAKWNIGNVSSLQLDNALKEEKQKEAYDYVGLLNISDYLSLKDNNWFSFKETMLLNKVNHQGVLLETEKGMINNILDEEEYSFVPVVYLRGDVSFISGDGTNKSPYKLDIIEPLSDLKGE